MRIWQFMEVADGGSPVWSWRVLGPSGNLEATSQPHCNYGAAVTDAIRHGFLPSNNHWDVITSAGATRFEPAASARLEVGLESIGRRGPVRTAGRSTPSEAARKGDAMGTKNGANTAHLSATEADIRREYPAATIKWDTVTTPYMVSVAVDGALARGFIQPEALAERGEAYEAFTRRLSELLTDSMRDHANANEGEDVAEAGVRAPLSAAKTRSPRSKNTQNVIHRASKARVEPDGATTSSGGDIK